MIHLLRKAFANIQIASSVLHKRKSSKLKNEYKFTEIYASHDKSTHIASIQCHHTLNRHKTGEPVRKNIIKAQPINLHIFLASKLRHHKNCPGSTYGRNK